MTHVAIICVSLRGGGTERVVCRVANHLASRHRVSILTLAPSEPFYDIDSGVELVLPGADQRRWPRRVRRLLQVRHLLSSLRQVEPDVGFVFGEDIAAAATVSARLAGVRSVWVFLRGTPDRSLRGLNGVVNPLAFNLAQQIMVQTTAAEETLSGRYPTDKLIVWPNPIDLPAEAPPMRDRERVILNVGSMGRLKNQEALLRVFASLDRRSGWRLVFVGDGPSRARLEIMAEELGVRRWVAFEGERRDVRGYLIAASIFAFTSLAEGFPNALAEALAAGCACISYDCPTGPAELIRNGIGGYLVPLGDEERFRVSLQALVDDDGLRAEIAVQGRAAVAKFESRAMLEELESMLVPAMDVDRGLPACES